MLPLGAVPFYSLGVVPFYSLGIVPFYSLVVVPFYSLVVVPFYLRSHQSSQFIPAQQTWLAFAPPCFSPIRASAGDATKQRVGEYRRCVEALALCLREWAGVAFGQVQKKEWNGHVLWPGPATDPDAARNGDRGKADRWMAFACQSDEQ